MARKKRSEPEPLEPLGVVSDATRDVLRRLELDVTRRLDGLLHGDHRGLVPGHGSELGETRRYAPGDDVRRIDWNVTARLQEAHVRETIAERELQTWLVVDRSARLAFGTVRSQKRELVLAGAAATGFLTNRDGNRIGAVYAGSGEPEVIPPRGSRRHFLRILHDIAEHIPVDGEGPTDLTGALARLAGAARRRGLVVVISDFLVAPGWEQPLRILAQRHDVLAVQISDPRDRELPNVGLVTLRDPATGAVREVATHKRSVRERFAEAAQERQSRLDAEFRASRVDHVVLSTDREWLDDLVRFVGRRSDRMARQEAAVR
ncbi:MAG: DUF58 domain-containing protein [Actinomycetota bacterium]